MLEALLNNPEQVTFSVLFITLLVWVLTQNDKREKRYIDTIDTLSNALNDFRDMRDTVEQINIKLDRKEGE